MLSEEKIRIMIRLSDYEQNKGKIDLERTRYFKLDYIRMQILKTLVSVSAAVFLVVLLVGLYHMEYIITNALVIDYTGMARYFLILYILLLLLFTFVTVSVSSVQYEASKSRVKEYYAALQELIGYYDREDQESSSADGPKEETAL